jgi:hypothetical protein
MKTTGFLFIICLLMSATISAQTSLNLKPDSGKIQIELNTRIFKFENIPPSYSPNAKNLILNQNLALMPQKRNYADPNFRMPVIKPEFQSNMPVMKPDSSVHYHLLIQKIRK